MDVSNSTSVYILFSVHNHLLLASGKYISDIVPMPEAKRIIPHSPSYLYGVCNSYNRTITMINLASFLGLENSDIPDINSKIMLIISENSRKIGLIADRVRSVEPSDNILHSGRTPFTGSLVSSVCVLKNTEEIALELNISEILSKI